VCEPACGLLKRGVLDSSSHELQPNLAHVRGTTIFVPVAFSQISLQNRRQLRTVLAASENFYRATPDAKGSFTPDALHCGAVQQRNTTPRTAPGVDGPDVLWPSVCPSVRLSQASVAGRIIRQLTLHGSC